MSIFRNLNDSISFMNTTICLMLMDKGDLVVISLALVDTYIYIYIYIYIYNSNLICAANFKFCYINSEAQKFRWKIYVLRFDLNVTELPQSRTSDGREFHLVGDEREHRREAVLVRNLSVANRFWPDERSVRDWVYRWSLSCK